MLVIRHILQQFIAANIPIDHQTATSLLTRYIIPCSIWRAGKRVGKLRGHGIECMDLLFTVCSSSNNSNQHTSSLVGMVPLSVLQDTKHNLASVPSIATPLPARPTSTSMSATTPTPSSYYTAQIQPILVNCLDDDDLSVRLCTVDLVGRMLSDNLVVTQITEAPPSSSSTTAALAYMMADDYKMLYTELIKRMDDSRDEVRIRAAAALTAWISCVDAWEKGNIDTTPADAATASSVYVEKELDRIHWEALLKGLLIHLDDTNTSVQVKKILKIIGLQPIQPSSTHNLPPVLRTPHSRHFRHWSTLSLFKRLGQRNRWRIKTELPPLSRLSSSRPSLDSGILA